MLVVAVALVSAAIAEAVVWKVQMMWVAGLGWAERTIAEKLLEQFAVKMTPVVACLIHPRTCVW